MADEDRPFATKANSIKFGPSQQQPLSAEQFQPQDISVKVPLRTSANGVSPKQDDYYNSPQQHLPSLNNNYPLPSTQCSDHQEPYQHSAGVPPKSLTYEEFIAAEEQEISSSLDPETGFPTCWPKVTFHPPVDVLFSSFPPVDVASPRVEEQPSLAKVSSPPVAKKAIRRRLRLLCRRLLL
ncbi:hypothetical protein PTKIN_Ptkin01aG0073700 [Pterospermum kingtungense]